MLTYALFIIGFVILIKGADLLVDGAVAIAQKLKIPSIAIGLTIIAFGTSAPEFMVNISARVSGNPDITIGDVLGSNIANILLVLGLSAIVYPITTNKNTTWKEIPFGIFAVALLAIMVNGLHIDCSNFAGLTRIDGIILVIFFILFLCYVLWIIKSTGNVLIKVETKELGYIKSIIFIAFGLIGLVLGGRWIVEGAVKIAETFNVSQSFIGLTIVAVGTSLPELATSVVAAYKKQTDIAIGNIVGSNIFNVFWVLGVSSIIWPLPFNPRYSTDVLMALLASIILFFAMFIGKKQTIERWKGFLMVVIYVGYVTFLIVR